MVPLRRPDSVYRLGPLELELWKISSNARIRYAYRFYDREWSELPVFEWDSFKMPEWATLEETALDILGYLTLVAADAEPWFFKDYSDGQLRWRNERAGMFQRIVAAEVRRLAAEPRTKHVLGVRRPAKGPKEWSPRKGEKVVTIANLGDVYPLDYGGFIIRKRTSPDKISPTFEAEYWPEPDEDGKYTIYVFDIDRLKLVDGYLVPFNYRPDWPHPVERYDEWFHDNLEGVASAIGTTKEALEADFISEDPIARAWAYFGVGSYHGFENLDNYPVTLTRKEMEKRWPEFA